jgi:DnaJ-domain-containing protein 1
LGLLEETLTQQELELATLSTELRRFEVKYLSIVGVRYTKLDEIEAKIAEALTKKNPSDVNAAKTMNEARARAQESAKATSGIPDIKQKENPQPSESLRTVYREAAKKVHPDLCTDEKERARRQKIMAEINRAYEEGDEEGLKKIINDWENSPDSIKGEDVGAQLVRILRQIAQVESRLSSIASEIETLHKSYLYQLLEKVEAAKKEGRDLLGEMASRLDNDISKAEKRLKGIAGK